MIRATRRARARRRQLRDRPAGAVRAEAGRARPRGGARCASCPTAPTRSTPPDGATFSTCARSPTPGRSAASSSPTASCSRRSPASATGSCGSRRSATAPGSWSPRWSRASASCTATSAPSREFLRIHPDEHPVSIQLFGHDAAVMREAAAMAAAAGRRPDRPQHGLPGAQGLQDRRRRRAARRPGQGGGDRARGARGQRPARDGRSCAPAASPATAPASTLARRLVEEAGVAGIAFHPRHASQQHSGAPDYALARELVERPAGARDPLRRPARASEHARRAFEESGAAAVMLARGSLGNPWLFARLLGPYDGEPTAEEVVEELEWVIASRRGAPRRGARGPLSAEVLSLVRRAPGPHEARARARSSRPPPRPTRERLRRLAGPATPLAA